MKVFSKTLTNRLTKHLKNTQTGWTSFADFPYTVSKTNPNQLSWHLMCTGHLVRLNGSICCLLHLQSKQRLTENLIGARILIFWSTWLHQFVPTCPADLTFLIHTVAFDRLVLWDMLSAPCTEPLAINLRNNLKITPPHPIQTNRYIALYADDVISFLSQALLGFI